jgi:precorrin-2/cobalt-factor-2 C20-methyltransferase
MTGTLYGIGVGPGDPELLTLKAVRLIQSTPVIAYPATPQGHSLARASAVRWLGSQQEIPIYMPCMTDREPVNRSYDEAAAKLAEELAKGRDVAILCEGDPLFYGSFSYLFQRLSDRFPCVIVPGISSLHAAAAVTGLPLATGNDRLAVIPATVGEETLRKALSEYDSIAILKPGRQRPRLLELLRETDRAGEAVYVEQATRADQLIIRNLSDLPATPGPYFALFLITRRSPACRLIKD